MIEIMTTDKETINDLLKIDKNQLNDQTEDRRMNGYLGIFEMYSTVVSLKVDTSTNVRNKELFIQNTRTHQNIVISLFLLT